MKLNKIRGMILAFLVTALFTMPIQAKQADSTSSIQIDKTNDAGISELTPKESDQLGSITIKLTDTKDKLPKDHVKFKLIKAADVVDGVFVLDEKYETADVDLNQIDTANELEDAAKSLMKYAKKEKGQEFVTDKTGIAKVENLTTGAYLVYAVDTAKYDDVTPLLASIPTWSEKEQTMLYDLTVIPKHSPKPTVEQDGDRADYTGGAMQTGLENKYVTYGLLSIFFFVLAIGVLTVTKKKKKATNE